MRTLRSLSLVAALSLAAPALAHGDEEEPAEGEAAIEHEGEGHAQHGGPVTFESILHNPELWTAALNFSLLVFLLVRFGKAPLRDFLSSRRKQMQLAIDEAAEAKRAAEAKLKEYNDRLAQLDSELAKLRSDLVAAGEEDKKRIVAEAEETAQRMRRETEALIDQHSKQLVTQVRREMVDAAVAASEKLVRERLGASDQQRLADAYRQQVSSKSGRPS